MDTSEPNEPSEAAGLTEDRRREARQRAYRARQAEVAVLLGRLWRLRRQREAGGRPVGIAPERKWEEFAVLLRQLVHEEELLAGLNVARRSATSAARSVTAEPGRAEGVPAEGGGPPVAPLTTAHNGPRKTGPAVSVPADSILGSFEEEERREARKAAGNATRKKNGRKK